MRNAPAVVVVVAVLVALVAQCAGAADDASLGYETIRPSLVKVWAFDRAGRPRESGTGVVVDSDARVSHVLTATHVVAGANSVRIDVSRDEHDLVAHVDRAGPRDLTLLTVERGGLRAATFAPRTRAVIEGNLVAVAGYVKNDELIGIVGQEPRILFPGTIASRPDGGRYLELENVHIEEGLSGGAVFDPATGEVLGIVTSRTSDQRGGFADSGALVVVPFLDANRIAAVALPLPPRRIDLIGAPPRVLPTAAPARGAAPRNVALTLPVAPPRPLPIATLQAVIGRLAALPAAIASWQATDVPAKRFLVVRSGCRIAVTIDVQTLQFIISHQALVAPRNRGSLLAIVLQQRAGDTLACDTVDDAEPTDGPYVPTAMSFDGHHVTMRFAYAGDAAGKNLFPEDASLDADLDGDVATATVQFFARDWNGAIALPLARTTLSAVSSSW